MDEPFDGDYMRMLFPSHAPPSRFFQSLSFFSRPLFPSLNVDAGQKALKSLDLFTHTVVAMNFSHLVSKSFM